MLTRAEVGGWKHPQKTSEASAGSQRGHSSLSTGKPCTWRRATAYQVLQSTTLLNVKAVNTVRCHAGRKRGEIPHRLSPCAVKVARTVTTGGMERRVKRYRALSLPTEVARSLRLDQSGPRVDQLAAERPGTGKTRFQAALLASTLAARLAHRPHLQTRPPQLGAPRTEAPLHTRRRALPRAVSCQSIAQAFDLKGAEAKQRWAKIAKILRPSGKDPNWR